MSTGAVRAGRRRLVRALPANRRVRSLGGAKGRGWLQARKLVAPLLQLPVTLTSADGLHLRVTGDPVDEEIAHYLLGPRRVEYFPAWPGGAPTGACILDVGAHHGLYAAAALHEYTGSRIVCVEPSRRAIPAIEANLAANDSTARARIVNAGLAAASGQGVLRHTDEGTWGASLYEDPAATTHSETVALLTLSELLDGEEPDIIKCNAEGAEFALIEQLAGSDLRPALMLVMVHPEFGDLELLMAAAEAMGYRISRVGTPNRPALQMWHETVLR